MIAPAEAIYDTSVLVRLFADHGDELQPRAMALYESWVAGIVNVVIIDLSLYEFINVMSRRLTTPNPVARCVERFLDMDPDIVAIDLPLCLRTVHLRAESGLSTYDAAFVAAGQLLRMPVITDDRKMLRAYPEVAIALADLTP